MHKTVSLLSIILISSILTGCGLDKKGHLTQSTTKEIGQNVNDAIHDPNRLAKRIHNQDIEPLYHQINNQHWTSSIQKDITRLKTKHLSKSEIKTALNHGKRAYSKSQIAQYLK